MSRISKFREVAASSVSASVNTFTPRRLLSTPWVTETLDAARYAATLPTTVASIGRDLLRCGEQIPRLVGEAQAIVNMVRALLRHVDSTALRAANTVANVDAVRADAAASVHGVQQLEKRVTVLLDRCEPLLTALISVDPALVGTTEHLLARLRPLLSAAADINLDAPAQAAALLARTGPLLDQIDTTLIPLLGELRDAVPDVRDILPVVPRLEPVMLDFDTRIAGLPGGARMRRRGESVLDEATSVSADKTADGEAISEHATHKGTA